MAAPYFRPIRRTVRDHYAAVMVRDTVRSLWAEPRAPDPPPRVWRDWVLVAALVPTALLEGVLRDDVVWRPVAVLLGVALPCARCCGGVPIRWPSVVVAFGAHHRGRHRQRSSATPDGVVGLYTIAFVAAVPLLAGAVGERPGDR